MDSSSQAPSSARGRARGRARPLSSASSFVSARQERFDDGSGSVAAGSVISGSTSGSAVGENESTTTGSIGATVQSVTSSLENAAGSVVLRDNVSVTGSTSSGSDRSKGIRQTIKPGFNKVGITGESFEVITNYLHMNKTPNFQLHQYRVDFQPEEDSTELKKLLVRSKEGEIGSYVFDGHMLYTTRPIPAERRNLKAGVDDKYEITIKTVGYVLPDSPMYVQFYNMVLRKCQKLLEMEELGRNFYDYKQAIKMEKDKLQLWPGVITAIRQHQVGMLLCVEITHKVLRMGSVLELMENLKPACRSKEEFAERVKKEVVGTIVMTHYNRRTYKVDDIDFQTTPDSVFREQDGTMTKYADFYLRRHNVEIKNLHQPMLVSYPKKKDQNKGITGNIYLVPSLCNPTGLTDDMRKDFHLMKRLSEHLHMGPNQRVLKLNEFVKRIRDSADVQREFQTWDIDFHPQYILADARKYPAEKVFIGPEGSEPTYGDNTADWTRAIKGMNRGMLQPKHFGDWILFVPSGDIKYVQNLVETLKLEGRKINVTSVPPIAIVQYDARRAGAITKTIRDELTKRGQDVKFAFIILPSNNAKTYNDVKKLCILDFGIGCQCLLAKNMNREDPKSKQKLGSICTKIMIQITAKLRGVPWGVKIPVKKLMVLGFDVYHCSERKGQSAGALVSTVDQSLNKYYSSVSFHADKSELANNLTGGMRKALQAFLIENQGALPDRVVMFRDGVGEGQINYVLDYEIPRLRMALETVYKDNEQNMCKLSVVIVTKKINSRVLLQKISGKEVKYDNVAPGTVVDNTITLPERYDFFLVSQSVNQGTVSPTNYNVVLDESDFTPDHMQKLSFKLCHLYYNWCGTVAVPAPCQYAHKLAYLSGVSLNEEAPATLANTLWYL